jgi:beta-lactamase superfamily II metal-dependent hydrolase
LPTSARLEIHVINVSQGDSVVIVNRDLAEVAAVITAEGGTLPADPIDYVPYAMEQRFDLHGTVEQALLVDGGPGSFGGTVVDYLVNIGVLPVIEDPDAGAAVPELSIMLSHHHDDHGSGLDALLRTPPAVAKKKKKKAGAGKAKFKPGTVRYWVGAVYRPPWLKGGDSKGELSANFNKGVSRGAARTEAPTDVYELRPGGLQEGSTEPTVISLGTGVDGIEITVHVLAAAQAVYDPATKTIVKITNTGVDQNDRSIAFVVQYGAFRFFSAGDIAGNGAEAGGNTGANKLKTPSGGSAHKISGHADVETTLGKALEAYFPATDPAEVTAGEPQFPAAGQVTVMKASHHGSASSNDVHMLATLRPAVVVVSSGVMEVPYNHPTPEFMNRVMQTRTPDWELRPQGSGETVDNTVKATYVTEIAQVSKKFGPFALTLDTTVEILGDIVVRPTDESVQAVQNATAFGVASLDVRVHGSGEQSTVTAGNVLLPTVATKAGPYPIGPFPTTVMH